MFQSTPRAWGATRHSPVICARLNLFQSTPRAWGATMKDVFNASLAEFQSTPRAWGATRMLLLVLSVVCVSIHAPRVGGDVR